MPALDDICIHSPIRSVTIDSPPLWDESLSFAAKGLYAVLCVRKAANVGISLDILIETSGGSAYSVRKAVDELKREGYLSIDRVRNGSGAFVGHAIWNLYPYAKGVQGELADMTPEQSMQRWLAITEKHNGKQNPRSVPTVEYQHMGRENCGKMENPRSVPTVEYQHMGRDSAPITKLNPLHTNIDSNGFIEGFSVEDGCCDTYEPIEEIKDSECDKGEGLVSFTSAREKVLHGREHNLRNCTESECRDIFDLIASRCEPELYPDDQYAMARPMIDELARGDAVYKDALMHNLKWICANAKWRVKKHPTYWLRDYGPKLREMAEKTARTWNEFG